MGTPLIIAVLLIIADQFSKYLILSHFTIDESMTIIEDFFFITHIRNSGAAWGILSNQAWGINLLTVVSIVVSIYLIYLIWINQNKVFNLLVGLILGGSFGNLVDRIRFNNVVDFLSFKFGDYYFPVFNLADCAIVVGSILLLIYFLLNQDALDEIKFSRKT